MREAIDNYTIDKHKAPESLQVLVDEHYLRHIPVDPVTQQMDWVPVYAAVSKGSGEAVVGIDDVRAGTNRTGRDGTPYSEW